jgi:mono/diheme cytochrome c family protein
MKYLTIFGLGILLIIGLTGCNGLVDSVAGYTAAPMRGMGIGSGMMARHHAAIPQDYAGLTNPVSFDEESLARGAEIYSANCAACHGDGGMGDGPAAAGLNPAPAPIAHTSLMLGDSYLFWRISEGGTAEPFSSTMPGWKTMLDEQARWDVINYVRAIGNGRVTPKKIVGGTTFDPEVENAIRAEILAQAVEQDVLTQNEADTFSQIHSDMDRLAASGTFEPVGTMDSREDAMLAELVESGKISQGQADAFNDIHNKLVESNLMQ